MSSFFSFMLANQVRIEFVASPALYLPKYLRDNGLANYEPLSIASYLTYAERVPGALFDVGANFGVYALLAATGLRRNVMAFEPMKEPATLLQVLAMQHDLPIEVIQMAISDEPGAATFFLSNTSDMSNSLNGEFRSHRGTVGVQTSTVDAFSLRRRPAIIKIDTETTEVAVLKGSVETLKRDKPAVLLEVLTDELAAEVSEFFAPLNYVTHEIGSAAFSDRFANVADYETSGDKRNWLLVPADKDIDEAFFVRANQWVEYIRKLK